MPSAAGALPNGCSTSASGWLQFAYGLCLPANPLPNASGYPRPDTPVLPYGAWAAGIWAVALPVVLLV